MKFYMLRLYTTLQDDGTQIDKSAVYVHNNQIAAMKQYYKMLATDIDDTTKPTVMCCVMNENGIVIAREKFYHPVEVTTSTETDNTDTDTENTSDETTETV